MPLISREAVTTRSVPALGLSLSRSSRFSASSSERCASTMATAALFASTASRFTSRCLNGPSRLSLRRSTNTSPTDCEGKLSGTHDQRADALEGVGHRGAEARIGGHAAREHRAAARPAAGRPPPRARAGRGARARGPGRAARPRRAAPPPLEKATKPRSPPAFSTASLTVCASSPSMSEVSRNRRLASSRARNSLLVDSETATYCRSISRRRSSARSPAGAPASCSHDSACSSMRQRLVVVLALGLEPRQREHRLGGERRHAELAEQQRRAPRRVGRRLERQAQPHAGRQQHQVAAPRRQRRGQLVGLAQGLEGLRRRQQLALQPGGVAAHRVELRQRPVGDGLLDAVAEPRRQRRALRQVRGGLVGASRGQQRQAGARLQLGHEVALRRLPPRLLERRDAATRAPRRDRRGRAPARRGTRAPAPTRATPRPPAPARAPGGSARRRARAAAAGAPAGPAPAARPTRPAGARSRARCAATGGSPPRPGPTGRAGSG